MDKKIVDPLDEAIVLFERLEETGDWYKPYIITDLYREGKLSRAKYSADCPLCHAYSCADCPWPRRRNPAPIKAPCLDHGPFEKWVMGEERALPRDYNRKWAACVARLLRGVKRKLEREEKQ